jgi:threonine/homoserine/homoserine lactone efflux protein
MQLQENETNKQPINKMGYSTSAGMLSMAYIYDSNPVESGLYFLGGFFLTYLAIALLEVFSDVAKERVS